MIKNANSVPNGEADAAASNQPDAVPGAPNSFNYASRADSASHANRLK